MDQLINELIRYLPLMPDAVQSAVRKQCNRLLGGAFSKPSAPEAGAASNITSIGAYSRLNHAPPPELLQLIECLLAEGRVNRPVNDGIMARVALQSLIEAALKTVQPLACEAEHRLEVTYPDKPVIVEVEPDRLQQALNEILLNAVAYTPKGGRISVTVRARVGYVEVEVQDDGTGIPQDLLPQIFSAYRNPERWRERASGRLGLGLGMARSTATKYGGTLRAASDGVGRGSTFTLTLPRVAWPATLGRKSTHAARESGRGHDLVRRALVVDNGSDAVAASINSLRRLGHQIYIIHAVIEVLEAAQEFRPDLILIDLDHHGTTGINLARRLPFIGLEPVPVVVPLTTPPATFGRDTTQSTSGARLIDLAHYHIRALTESCARFLSAELQLAYASIRRATTSADSSSRERSLRAATRCCDTVEALLPRLTLRAARSNEIAGQLESIRTRLKFAGT